MIRRSQPPKIEYRSVKLTFHQVETLHQLLADSKIGEALVVYLDAQAAKRPGIYAIIDGNNHLLERE